MVSQKISLKEAERKVFTSVFQDGLWDIFVGCVLLQFAIGPFLSRSLGDFWSSVVFLPFFALVYLIIWLVRRRVVTPRVGVVKFGAWRKTRMIRFNLVMLAVGVVALILGVLSAVQFDAVPGWTHAARFSLVVLVWFSGAAYMLAFTRLYAYGLLVAIAPMVGEWLWENAGASHHGFPITFGFSAGVIILVGLVKFIHLLRNYPVPNEV